MNRVGTLLLSRWTDLRRLVVWCLLIALPFYGLGTTIDALLGPVHVHAAQSVGDDPMAGWQDFRRIDHVSESAIRVHSHDAFGRHRHALNDHSVLRLGGDHQDDGGGGDVASSSTETLFVTAEQIDLPGGDALVGTADWQKHRTALFTSCDSRRLERPPRT